MTRSKTPPPAPSVPLKYRKLATASAAAVLAALLGACGGQAPGDPGGGVAGGKADELDTDGTDTDFEDTDFEDTDEGMAVAPEYLDALDVHRHEIVIGLDVAPLAFYERPNTAGVSLGGTEFWQRWPGGHSPTFSYAEGTEQGRKCMQASAIRFAAIMADPPEAILRLRDETHWSGSFFNWNDDFTHAPSSTPSSARLWAWRTHLIKWISQTGADGTCLLPTLEMVESIAANCLATAEANDGEIQGCRN
jgi:hypothetical protein